MHFSGMSWNLLNIFFAQTKGHVFAVTAMIFVFDFSGKQNKIENKKTKRLYSHPLHRKSCKNLTTITEKAAGSTHRTDLIMRGSSTSPHRQAPATKQIVFYVNRTPFSFMRTIASGISVLYTDCAWPSGPELDDEKNIFIKYWHWCGWFLACVWVCVCVLKTV